jgi:hypothetical protein
LVGKASHTVLTRTGFLSKRRGLMWFFSSGNDKIDTIWMSHGYLVEKKLPEPVKKSYIYPENTDLKIKSSEISNI